MRRRTTSLFAGLALISMTGLAAAGPFGKPEAPSLIAPVWSLTGECYPIDFNGIDIEWYAGRGVYWRTVVIGCVKNGLLMPLASPYYITMNLDQFVGSRGVEIVGASRKVRRGVPKS